MVDKLKVLDENQDLLKQKNGDKLMEEKLGIKLPQEKTKFHTV